MRSSSFLIGVRLQGLLLRMIALGCLVSSAMALPSIKGDLDEDGRYTVRDVARLVNHLQQIEFLHPIIQPFADVTGDGLLDEADVEKLVDLVLDKTAITDIPPARPLESSPAHGENQVALTREAVVRFSLPLAPAVTLTPEDFALWFAGKRILSRVEISSDRLKATVFPLEQLPASARVALYPGRWRPACRIIHTGGGQTGWPESTVRIGLFVIAGTINIKKILERWWLVVGGVNTGEPHCHRGCPRSHPRRPGADRQGMAGLVTLVPALHAMWWWLQASCSIVLLVPVMRPGAARA